MRKFNVTFKENKKYNAMTRTILVETSDRNAAESLIVSEFGSWSKGELGAFNPSGRITILDVEEVKEEE